MKALIHVGLSKTGTTTIQNFLQANAATLRQRGIYYLRYFGRSSQPEFTLAVETRLGQPVGNVNLRAAMRLSGNFPRQQRLAAAFERRLAADLAPSGCDRFIGSSEYLAHMGRTPAYIAALDAWMRERFAEVRYVVYLRRQDDWLISTYSQHIRGGGTLSLDEFLAWRKPPNFERLVTRWEGVLGAERLDVRLFDRASFVDGDLLADFCAAAGLDLAGLASAASLNERLGPRQARLIRACNAAIGRAVAAETPNFMLRRAAGGLVALVPPGTARLALAPGVRERIMAACARSNERLRRRRFPGRAVLFP